MTKLLNSIVFFAMMCVTGFAGAATYYPSKDNCEAAWLAGKAENYQPTGKHKSFGDERVKGFEKRPLEGDACVLLGAQPGKRWVFLKQGTQVYTKGADIKFLAECQNDMFEIVFLKKEEPKAAPAPEQKVVQITEVIQKDIILKENFFCEKPDGTRQPATIQNGQPVCPEVKITAPILIDEPIRVRPHVVQTPRVVQAPPTSVSRQENCPGGDCHREARVTRTEPRTDGRCVLAMRDTQTGQTHFVRLETKQGTMLLVAARVNDMSGEWNRSNPLSHVGDGTKSVQMAQKDCFVARDAFLSRRSFEWTATRIGLPMSCVPVGTPSTGNGGYTTPRNQTQS